MLGDLFIVFALWYIYFVLLVAVAVGTFLALRECEKFVRVLFWRVSE